MIGLPARWRLGKRPPQGIVDHLFHRCPRAVGGLVNELGDVGVKSQGSTHIDIIVPPNGGIKMPCRLGSVLAAVPVYDLAAATLGAPDWGGACSLLLCWPGRVEQLPQHGGVTLQRSPAVVSEGDPWSVR
jgi:hypothetical protein